MRELYLYNNKGIETTLIYFCMDGVVRSIELYSELAQSWIPIHFTEQHTNPDVSRLIEKCQEAVDERVAKTEHLPWRAAL